MVPDIEVIPIRRPRRKERSPRPLPVPQVSEETQQRLYVEAASHPAFEGMAPEDIKAFIDEKA
jgi:hypothetical protein